MNSVNTHIYLPENLYNEVMTLSLARGESFAEVVRDLLTRGLKKKVARKTSREHSNPLDWLMSFHAKGPDDGSTNHDKYIYDE